MTSEHSSLHHLTEHKRLSPYSNHLNPSIKLRASFMLEPRRIDME
jgi:hypothetical protein